jgi:hypothetical protein
MCTASVLRDHHSEPLHVPYSFREVNGYRFTKHVNALKVKTLERISAMRSKSFRCSHRMWCPSLIGQPTNFNDRQLSIMRVIPVLSIFPSRYTRIEGYIISPYYWPFTGTIEHQSQEI